MKFCACVYPAAAGFTPGSEPPNVEPATASAALPRSWQLVGSAVDASVGSCVQLHMTRGSLPVVVRPRTFPPPGPGTVTYSVKSTVTSLIRCLSYTVL